MSPRTVILSPHFDDAVLSCWHRLTARGEVAIVNVFTGIPGPGVRGWWDKLTGVEDSAAHMGARDEEDRRALALAGRSPSNLGFLDGQYRDSPVETEALLQSLRPLLRPDDTVLAPADFGAHADHRAVRDAALALQREGLGIELYADSPHASLLGWPAWVAGVDGSGTDQADACWRSALPTGLVDDVRDARITKLTDSEMESKLRAVSAYASQVEPLTRVFGELSDHLAYEVGWRLSAPGSLAGDASGGGLAQA
jgi:LmbE family N-acetylglucosaminyl deacetylase